MITYDINVCIGMDNPDKHIAVKCHDTGVNIRVHPEVCRRGMYQIVQEPYNIPPGCTAVMKLAKPDKTYCITDGVIEGGTILCKMKPQAFTAIGIARAEVSIFGEDGRRVTSATFNIHIDSECLCDCDQESNDYVDVMAQQIMSALEAEKSAQYAALRAERAAESINGGSTGSGSFIATELEKVKTTKDGHEAFLRIHLIGLEKYAQEDQLSVQLYRAATRRGRAGRWSAANKWGYGQIAGKKQLINADTNLYAEYPPVPAWMPGEGYIQSRIPILSEDLTRGYIDIDLCDYLLPLLKPGVLSNAYITWRMSHFLGLSAYKSVAHHIKFHVIREGKVIGRCVNSIAFGVHKDNNDIDMTNKTRIPRDNLYFSFK